MEILKVENLCKEYGSGDNKVQAIKNMNGENFGKISFRLILRAP